MMRNYLSHPSSQGVTAPTALQLRYSYLQPRPFVRGHVHDHRFGWITDEVLDYADQNPGQELFAYTTLMTGSYERSDRPFHEAFDHPGTTRRLEALTQAAADLDVTRSEVVLAWLTGGAPAVTPVVGVSAQAQLAKAVSGARLVLPTDVRSQLDAAW